MNVQKNGEQALIAVNGKGLPLFRWNWLASIPVNWNDIKAVRVVDERRMVESIEN